MSPPAVLRRSDSGSCERNREGITACIYVKTARVKSVRNCKLAVLVTDGSMQSVEWVVCLCV